MLLGGKHASIRLSWW